MHNKIEDGICSSGLINFQLFQDLIERYTIYAPTRCSSTLLHKKANIAKVDDRLNSLGKCYLDQAIINRNPVITLLTEDITNSAGNR